VDYNVNGVTPDKQEGIGGRVARGNLTMKIRSPLIAPAGVEVIQLSTESWRRW
jgi:hypothetical protein